MDDKQKKVVSSIIKDFQKKNKRDPKDQKELAQFVQSQGGKKYIERKTQEVLGKQSQEQPQEQTTEQKQKALHGAKLNYFKSLKHQCAEDEEIVYYRKGGSVGCGCKKKMEEGGQAPKNKNNAIDKFKNRKQDQATKDSIAVNNYGAEDIEATRPGTYKKNKEGKLQWTPDRTKAPYNKKDKVKKNCGGSAIKKFKMHRQGGSLNRIPFFKMEK